MFKSILLAIVDYFFLQVDTNILPGDLIVHVNNEEFTFEAVAIMYDRNLKPMLFFKDLNRNTTYSAPVHEYKRAPLTAYYGTQLPLF